MLAGGLLPLAFVSLSDSLSAAARGLVLALRGRNAFCSLPQALRGLANAARHPEIQARLIRTTRLLKTDREGFELWETPKGRYWTPPGDRWLPFILAEGERRIYGLGRQGVRAGDVVLDCGAHVGTFTRLALSAGPRLVVAIEPGRDQLVCLRRNLASEIGAGRVMVYEKGVWDRDESLMLYHQPHNPGGDSLVIPASPEGEMVSLTTIDRLVAELKLERVDFIKMDIEGSEQRALMGAQQTLAKYMPRMAIAVYHKEEDPDQLPLLVRRAWPGYRVECGPCREVKGVIRPDVLYFH